jgi:hypothetical protein
MPSKCVFGKEIFMKLNRLFILCLFCFAVLNGLTADTKTQVLESHVLESWDDENSLWEVVGSTLIADGYPQKAYANIWPSSRFGMNPENKDKMKSFGVKAAFDRKQYNSLEIFPVEKDKDGNLVPRALTIPGRVQSIDLWVWGSNYDYDLEVQLEDYRGFIHTLSLGNLNFTGWKNLRVQIPSGIPQSMGHIPNYKGLKFVKLVLWTKPHEDVSGFYVYFDHLNILTDMFETPFDGVELTQPEFLDETWGKKD